jgi:hypothetical protein
VTVAVGSRRVRRLVVSGVAVLGLGVTLSACGNSGTTLAQQACSHVTTSLHLLKRADQNSDPTAAAALRQKAYLDLRAALPLSAEAAYHDGQWQALMTTVAESTRVPEQTLVTALEAQCQQADSSSAFGQPSPPTTIPPPAPVSSGP